MNSRENSCCGQCRPVLQVFLTGLMLAAATGCDPSATLEEEARRVQPLSSAVDQPSVHEAKYPQTPVGIHNFMRLSDRVLSGSEPENEESFSALAAMGVTTIVSVDGAIPAVESARKHGLQYVHIPFGYDAIPLEAQYQLIRVLRDTTGPIYFHCHHGKHRGPAGAAIVCQAEGTADKRRALQILTEAGTGRDYAGLWRDVEQFQMPSEETKLPELFEVAEIRSLTAAMAQISRSFDAVSAFQKAGWQSSAQESQQTATHSALLLQEELHEALRNSSMDYDDEFRDEMAESDRIATALYESLKGGRLTDAAMGLADLESCCTKCHNSYRN